jgi:predicted unusual protein kinase regulating ubiquinone biosynthesis (AarF/ABC1/UbiB family)
MSMVDGRHMDGFLSQRPSRKVRDLVGERLFELFYFQLLEVEAFHADPHGGNYLFGADGSIGLIDFGCVKRLTPEFVASMRELYLYPGARDSAQFRALIEKRHSLFGTNLRPAARQALINMADTFYGKVYPPDIARDSDAYDFGDGTVLQDYARNSQILFRSRAAMPEYIFLARAEIGLYSALTRLRARVHTSRIVRKYLRR